MKRVELLEERDKRKEEKSRAFLSVARAWTKFLVDEEVGEGEGEKLKD